METGTQFHPQINPHADVRSPTAQDDARMTISDYLIDSALILLVLMQIKERPLTARQMLRPVVIVGIAAFTYIHTIPTAGNDLVLLAALALIGGTIGAASGFLTPMRLGADGRTLVRGNWASSFLWVLGMGSRMAFAVWAAHGGITAIGHFSAANDITSDAAWTAALLAMAVAEVLARTGMIAARTRSISREPVLATA